MYTRIVECHVKPETRDEVEKRMRNEVLSVLQKQPGFVDLIALESEDETERLVAISFWNTKHDAERYHREHYPRVAEILKPYLTSDPRVETFNVGHSTAHRISADEAA